MGFTHLHVHTEYSLLDGAARIKDVVKRAKELGMDSLAITDHGAMFGVIDFYKECKALGIKPIIGCEVYTAARTMLDKDFEKDKYQGHLVLLAKNNEGYKNLTKIVSASFTKGFYYKPRVDKDLLRAHSNGIIALSACLAGNVQRMLLNRDYDGAKKEALELFDIFGEENFYLELQDQGLEEEAQILPGMKRIHNETGIPFVATNDVHYVNKEDAEAHDILLCIQTLSTVDDENRMRFPNNQFYLKSEDEMRKIFAGIPEAVDNAQKIADRCAVEFKFGELHLPEFKAPGDMANKAYLRQLCEEGIVARYGDENGVLKAVKGEQTFGISEANEQELRERLEYELSTIENMGYVEYFLIVWDFINYAKSRGIAVGPGRGSAAGSIVAYALKITDIDPIKHNLIFERFLNPERVSMPDIDVDFCYERRSEVIDYVVEKYGEANVSQIITFGTMKAKAAVRDVGRALNLSYADTDAVAKMIPFSLKMTIDEALKVNPDLKTAYDGDERIRQVLDAAKAIEGMPRHASTHAAGVVISREPLDEYVPLYMTEKGVATQFPMNTIEELGLLKMDFLGLRTLTVIRDALDLIEGNHGVVIEFDSMDYDDPAVYKLISSGNTEGVFQLESGGMKQFMKELKPDCFEDIVAGISLYRPGPMSSIPTYIENKKNPENIEYIHESLEHILSVTYGCLVYQEQVMQTVRDLAGYSYGRSDLMRRAMSKKKVDVMLTEKEYFINGMTDENGEVLIPGCIRNGVPEETGEEIYNRMVSFAEYAFNKSHAAAYAVIAYETAYLKAYYPVEFMAALMTSVIGDVSQISKYIRNCKELGIDVLPPDVNESGMNFTVKDGKIRFGLFGVKNTGEGVIDAIISAREEKGLPGDIFTFISNLDICKVNKKAVESLIKAGALNCLKGNRAQHMAVYKDLIESAQHSSKNNIAGQISFFQLNSDEMEKSGSAVRLPDISEFNKKILMTMEKEMLGVYISEHPLSDYESELQKICSVTSDNLMHATDSEEGVDGTENIGIGVYDGMKATMGGIITHRKQLTTKNGKQMAFITLEDMYGEAEGVIFPNIYEKYKPLIEEDKIVVIRGTINFKEDEIPKILADSVVDINTVINRNEPIVKIKIAGEKWNRVKNVLKAHRGNVPVIVYMDGKRSMKASRELWVEPTEEFRNEIEAIAGEGNIKC